MAGKFIAAAAAPIVLDLLLPRPKSPAFDSTGLGLPDREAEKQALLDLARDPQSNVFRLAGERAFQNVQQQAAQSGNVGSSQAFSQNRAIQAQLAQDFLENALRRQREALQAVSGIDQAEEGALFNVRSAEALASQNQFLQDAAQRQALIGGAGRLGSSIAQGFQSQGAANALERQQAADRAFQFASQAPQATQNFGQTQFFGNLGGQ